MAKWKPGDDYFVRMADKTAEKRTPQEIEAMIESMRRVVEQHDFTIGSHGSWRSAQQVALGELESELRHE